VSLYKRGETWWVYIVHHGQRFRRSTGEREKLRAQRVHDELKANLWKSRDRGTVHGALETWVQGKGESDRYHVAKLKRLVPNQPIDGVDAEKLAKLIPHRTAGTFNRYVNVLRAAGIHGLERKKNPAGRIRWLTAEEWTSLRPALPDPWVPMADFAIATGLRQANVFWMEWAHVDLTRRRAWIQPDEAKGGEAIAVPLSEAAIAVLEHQRGRSEVWVFPMADP
jgi:integrase